ncbi:MAG: hypothetical protein B7Y90_15385 [Alphaproteobacteria bacterium 32-64-14]|nr:MAG: hypothetical protein B7Y90_15385 [Alphaproteobacteria bacterium 32-64-14]
MLKKLALIAPALFAMALAACQPEPTPEQKAAAALQQLGKDMAAALGGDPNAVNIDPKQLGAALAQAGAIAGAANAEMTAEDRAQLNAITGAMASGQVHPAASAYVAGLDKVFTIVSTVTDDASAAAAKPKVDAIYAEMAAPAATLKAMSESDRQVAFGSAYPQLMGFGLRMAGIMLPLTSKPALADKVGKLLEGMPATE